MGYWRNLYSRSVYKVVEYLCVSGRTVTPYGYLKIENAKEFFVLHNTVENNYISPSSTVGIQLHVSALYVGHLCVRLYV